MNSKKRLRPYSAKSTAVWLLVLLIFVGEFFFYTWCRVQCVRLRYDINTEKETATILAAEAKDLKIEIARLGSPARIMAIAKQKGLVMPTTDQIVILP